MIGLVAFVEDHWSALEADFTSVYGLDLRRELWGDSHAGCRRVLSLVEKLHAESATVRSVAERGRREAEEAARPKTVRDAVQRFFGGGD